MEITFGEFLRQEILKRFSTLEEFANELKTSKVLVSKWVNNINKPNDNSLSRIAMILEVKPDILFQKIYGIKDEELLQEVDELTGSSLGNKISCNLRGYDR